MDKLISEYVRTRNLIGTIEALGGSDSFFGYKTIFEELLLEEHEKTRDADGGMYRYKGMEQYSNIVSPIPCQAAMKRFLEYGHPVDRLIKLADWYEKRSIDTATLSLFIKWYIEDENIQVV